MAATRCTVFIDGSNFYHGLRRLGVDSQDLDYRRMVEKLLADRELRGIRYYVGRVSGDLPRMRRQSRALNVLRRQGVTRGARKKPAGATRKNVLAEVVDAIDGDEWQALAAPIIEPVLARAKADPEGLLDDIASAYPEMDAEALTERLARILFVAEVYGRADAS